MLIPGGKEVLQWRADNSLGGTAQVAVSKKVPWGFPGGAVVKNPANAGDTGLIPGLGRSHMLWRN